MRLADVKEPAPSRPISGGVIVRLKSSVIVLTSDNLNPGHLVEV
jgi:hypothetical protein